MLRMFHDILRKPKYGSEGQPGNHTAKKTRKAIIKDGMWSSALSYHPISSLQSLAFVLVKKKKMQKKKKKNFVSMFFGTLRE